MNTWKVIQRKTYDILSHKYFIFILIPFLLGTITLLSVIEVGEVWVLWKQQSSSGAGSVRKTVAAQKLCGEETAIDVVYTWVNGSDPLLLENLRHYREQNELDEGLAECPYRDCEPSHLVVYRGFYPISKAVLEALPTPNKLQKPLFPKEHYRNVTSENGTLLLFEFTSLADATQAAQIKIPESNTSLSQAYWTSDLHVAQSYPASQWVRLSGLMPNFLSLPVDLMKERLSDLLHLRVLELWLYPDHGCVIIRLPSVQAVDHVIVLSGLLSVDGDVVVASRLALVLDIPIIPRMDRYSPSRFEDKEELRYSLRSLVKHASWVRHVYLVTNGQIPHWLDLNNPHISIVTHSDIFPNKSHLPTFSSPAIESHLHRIRGLSSKFLYLNDDVMFGKDVWPEDFYTNSKGYKVYLSWPVPDCSPSCLWSWVADGSCDIECNVKECGFDGGDCNKTSTASLSPRVVLPKEEISMYDEYLTDDLLEQSLNHNVDFDYPDMANSNELDDHKHQLVKDFYQRLMQEESKIKNSFLGVEKGDPLKLHNSVNVTKDSDKIKNATQLESIMHGVLEKRSKRTVVKKNLGSKSFVGGSSMVAGRSADFLGSVVDSPSAIKLARTAAEKLRNAEKVVPMNSVHANSENRATKSPHIGMSTVKEPGFLNIQGNSTSLYGGPDRNSGHFDYPIDSILKNLNLINQQSNQTNVNNNEKEHKKTTFAVTLEESTEPARKNKQTKIPKRRLKEVNNTSPLSKNNQTKTRQRLHYLLEQDLNESVDEMIRKKERLKRLRYGRPKHRILDAFAESLLFVNMMYNRVYGFETRRVPAHAPHLIDKHIMLELQQRFQNEWDKTSSHKLRSSQDMQYAFSYFYFLMSEEVDVTLQEVFNIYDTDGSGTWSDREIRTLLTRLYPAPLSPHHLIQFEEYVLSCSQNMPHTETPPPPAPTTMYERYQDSPLPTVTWELVKDCLPLRSLLDIYLSRRRKYHHEIVHEWNRDVTFKMLTSNVSHLVSHLDDIRRTPKKFICLNDNLDPKMESENAMARALLRDFYHSLFPIPSHFELPPDMRNRFLHVRELNEWKQTQARLHSVVFLAVVTLFLLTMAILYPDQVRHLGRFVIDLVRIHCHHSDRSRTRRSPHRQSRSSIPSV